MALQLNAAVEPGAATTAELQSFFFFFSVSVRPKVFMLSPLAKGVGWSSMVVADEPTVSRRRCFGRLYQPPLISAVVSRPIVRSASIMLVTRLTGIAIGEGMARLPAGASLGEAAHVAFEWLSPPAGRGS